MQKKSRLTRILITLFATCMLGVVLLLEGIIYRAADQQNTAYIPEDATFVARISGRTILKEGLFHVVFQEDQALIALFEEQFKKGLSDEKRRPSLGIDLKSDLIFFQLTKDQHQLDGMLLNLTSPATFEANIHPYLNANQVAVHLGGVGLILHDPTPPPKNAIPRAELMQLAWKMLKNPNAPAQMSGADNDSEAFASTWTRSKRSNSFVKSSEISYTLSDKTLAFEGRIAMESHRHEELNMAIQPAGFHVSARSLSQNIKDSISVLLKGFELPTNKLCGISMNYYGMELVEEPTLYFIPYIDLLMKFDANFDLKSTLDSLQTKGTISELGAHNFNFGAQTYFWKQLDSTTIYIGIHELKLKRLPPEIVVLQTGHPALLTKVDGEGMMRKFLNLVPMYSASSSFSGKIEDCTFTITKARGRQYAIQGEIEFKAHEFALNSLLRFLIESQVLR